MVLGKVRPTSRFIWLNVASALVEMRPLSQKINKIQKGRCSKELIGEEDLIVIGPPPRYHEYAFLSLRYFLKIKNFFFMCGCFAWMYMWPSHAYLAPMKVRRKHCILWSWNYGWLWATMCALGTKPWSSAKPQSNLNLSTIYSEPENTFKKKTFRYTTQEANRFIF